MICEAVRQYVPVDRHGAEVMRKLLLGLAVVATGAGAACANAGSISKEPSSGSYRPLNDLVDLDYPVRNRWFRGAR